MIYPLKYLSLFFVLCFFGFVINANAQTWVPVGAPCFSDSDAFYTVMILDSSGTPYVAYSDNANARKVTVMKYDGSSWVIVGTAGFSSDTAEWITIAFDNNGILYAAFEEKKPGPASVMKYNGSSWVYVGSPGFSVSNVTYTSLAIDSSNTPYVVYSGSNTDGVPGPATVMKYDGINWVTVGSPNFSGGIAHFTSIAIDPVGIPYVAYEDYNNDLKATVMKYDGANWVTVGNAGFSAGGAPFPTIAIDKSGTPYVAYADDSAEKYRAITVMKYIDTNWVNVGSPGFSAGEVDETHITIDATGNPYVIYGDYSDGLKATVKKFNGTNWETVGNAGFSNMFAWSTSIAINREGIPYVAFDGTGNKATVMKLDTTATAIRTPVLANPIRLTIFPDPNHGAFTLNISTPQTEQATIIITNMVGEKVKETTATTNTDIQIHLDSLPGIYFISATTSQGKQSAKIAVQ